MSKLLSVWILMQMCFPYLGAFLLVAFKCVLIVTGAWIICRLFPRLSARAKNWLWRSVLVLLFCLPILALTVPLTRSLIIEWGVKPPPTDLNSAFDKAIEYKLIRTHEAAEQERKAAVKPSQPPWLSDPFVSPEEIRTTLGNQIEKSIWPLWGVGALLAGLFNLIKIVGGIRQLRKRSSNAAELLRSKAQGILEACEAKGAVELRLSPALSCPLLLGLRNPCLCLPSDAGGWETDRLESVFLHEFAHWKRKDLWWLWLSKLVAAVWWWNPAAFVAIRSMLAEAEKAADDLVLEANVSPDLYARTLLDLATIKGPRHSSLGVMMIGRGSLEKRIRALLETNPWRNHLSRKILAMLSVLVLLGIVVLFSHFVISERSGLQVSKDSQYFSPKQMLLLKSVYDGLTANQTALRFIHIKSEFVYTEIDRASGVKMVSPQPSKMEAWVDQWTGMHRQEFHNKVTRRIEGAVPYMTSDTLEINDGKYSYSFREESDLNTPQGGEPRGMGHYLTGDSEKELTIIIRQRIQVGIASSGIGSYYELEEIEWEGRPAIRFRQCIGEKGNPIQQKTYIVDRKIPHTLWFHELAYPRNEFSYPSTFQVIEMGESAEGHPYPKKYRFTYSSAEEEKFTDVQVTSFEVLNDLPKGITDLPKPKTAAFVQSPGPLVARENISLHLVNELDGIEAATVQVEVRINKEAARKISSDKQGILNVQLPKTEINLFEVRIQDPRFAKHVVSWSKAGDPLALPESYEIRLQPASPISGIIRDEVGKGIPGATVSLLMIGGYRSNVFVDRVELFDVETKTDNSGRWTLDGFPPDLKGIAIRASHPDYQASTDSGTNMYRMATGQDPSSLRDGTAVLVLKKGLDWAGVVQDEQGRPVYPCTLTIGDDIHGNNAPMVETDREGRFRFKGLREGKDWVTVESPTHKPLAREVTLPLQENVSLRLVAGNVVQGRVLKEDGTPAAEVYVGVDTWNKLRTLRFSTQTDEEGRFTWRGAPDEGVTTSFRAFQNLEFLSDYLLQAKTGNAETVITLKPALRFKAKVQDAKDGKPVPSVRVTAGQEFERGNIMWYADGVKTFADGQVNWTTSWMGKKFVFRVEAEGYETQQTATYESNQSQIEEVIHLVKR